jgi:hypothetical protein
VLRVVAGPAMGEVIEVSDELHVGRQAPTEEGKLGNDIEISRRHARVGRESDGRFTIEDLGSTNGTFVGGQRVFGPTALKPHDVIELGDTRLLVLHPAEAPSLSGGEPPAGAQGATTFSAVPEELVGEADAPASGAEEADLGEAEDAGLAAEPAAVEPATEIDPREPLGPAAGLGGSADVPHPGLADEPAAMEPATGADVPGAEAAPTEVEPVVEPDAPPPAEEAAPPLDATPPLMPVVDATPEATPILDATPEPTPVVDATPEPTPVLDTTPAPAPAAPGSIGVRLGMDPATGEVIVDVDDPDGPVRFVKRGGDWVIERP